MHLIRIKNQKIRSGLSPAFLLLNILIIFFCHIAFANSVSQSEQIKKATQNKIHLPAESIISLAPNLTDLLVNIGAQNQLVGVSAGLEQLGLPKQVMALPKVYNISTVNLEMIVALRPDLIVLWKEGTSPLVLKTLRKLNM